MNWFRRMMIGRYGTDALCYALVVTSLVLTLVGQITRWGIFNTASLVALVICYLRVFSRNTSRRYQENVKFLKIWNPIQRRLHGTAEVLRDSRTHCHYKCPSCGQKVRVPRGRGRVNISCPSCHLQFIKKT